MASFHHRVVSGKKGTAKGHAAYIARRGPHSNREDLVHSGYGNLPAWAHEDPAVFWKAADTFERSNGAVYREHEIALPNELTLEQNCFLAERLVQKIAGDKPFQFAVHAPIGSLSGVPNVHLHSMHSDRLPDGVNRPPERTFARYNAKHPEMGGRRKDSGGKTRLALRQELIATRKKIADIENAYLAELGIDARVDHRSLKEQGSRRHPERHLGPARIRGLSDEDKARFTALRRAENAGMQATRR